MKRPYKSKAKSKAKGKVSEAVKKYIKSTISKDIENKYFLQDWAATSPLPATGSFYLLSHSAAMVQGTGVQNRLGDQVRLKDLKINLVLRTPSTYNSYARVLLVQFKNPNGVALALTDIMPTSAGAGPNRVLYPPQQLHERVKILYDKVHHVQATGNVTADYNYKFIKITKNSMNIKQTYITNGNAGTYADVETNSLYLVILGSVDNTSVARCEAIDMQHYITFEDA